MKKKLVTSLVVGLLMFGLSVYSVSASTVLLEDNFNDGIIDPIKWTVTGHTAYEEDGIIKLKVEVTDTGPILKSIKIAFNPSDPIVIEKKTNLHYANNYFIGHTDINFGDGDFRFNISYANMVYSSGQYSAAYGFYIVGPNGNVHQDAKQDDISGSITPIWNQWFDEKIAYNPLTGNVDYFMNDLLVGSYNVGILPDLNVDEMSIHMTGRGWWTGHHHNIDDLSISSSPVPLPASVFFFGSGLAGLVGIRLKRKKK